MIQKRFGINALVGQEIRIGRVGENRVRCVEFDVSDWLDHYQAGFFVVFVVPPASSCASSAPRGYLAKTTYQEGVVSWVITSNDTKYEGTGSAEVIMYGYDNTILQSTTFDIRVSPSASHSTPDGCGCAPNQNQPWVDQVVHLAMDAQDAADRAEDALEEIKQVAFSGGLPPGGATGQVLAKASDKDQDVIWKNPAQPVYTIINGGDSYGK